MNQETKNNVIERFEDAVEAALRWDSGDTIGKAMKWANVVQGIAALEALELSQRAAQVIGPRPFCVPCEGTGEVSQGGFMRACRYCAGTGVAS